MDSELSDVRNSPCLAPASDGKFINCNRLFAPCCRYYHQCACAVAGAKTVLLQFEEPFMHGTSISMHPIHLGLGAKASTEPAFTGSMDWYGGYVGRHESDGAEGRLVSTHSFKDSWNMWEMHPQGYEVVLCMVGKMTLHQEGDDGTRRSIVLGPGEYAINEPGTWHTADADGSATALFITAGLGTQHRPR